MPNTLSDLLTRYAHLPASAIAGKLNEALSRDGAAVVTAPPERENPLCAHHHVTR